MGCVAQFQLKLKISPLEKEKSVGPFNVDILAEDNRGRTVIIENQLDKTDLKEGGNSP
jgi:RecB family endonuclease NucS